MSLGKWIKRYIVEVEPTEPEAQTPAPTPETPPAELAQQVRLVPTQRTAEELLQDLEPPSFDEAELAEQKELSNAPTPDPEESARLRSEAAAAAATLKLQAPAIALEKDPLDDGEDPPIGVPQVYAAAKIGQPLHGFSLEKIGAMLQDPRMAALPRDARASAIAVLLENAGVKLEEVVKDAGQRDQALDRFEDFLTEKLIELEVEIQQKNEELDAEIERLIARKREQRQQNEARLQSKRVELARFRRVKRAEEQRLFDVVAYFTEENPVDVTPIRPEAD